MDKRFSELLINNPAASRRLFDLNQQILSAAVKQTSLSQFMRQVLSIFQCTFNNEEVMIITGPADKRTCYRFTHIEGRSDFSSIYNVPLINSLDDAEALFRKKRVVYRSFRKNNANEGGQYSYFSLLRSGSREIGSLAMAAGSSPFSKDDCILIDQIADTLSLAMISFENRAALTERIKELTCLYKTAQLSANPNFSLSEIFREVIKLLPPAWQYPDLTIGKIVFDGRVFISKKYVKCPRTLQADIVANNRKRGFIEVAYLKKVPIFDEGPFLKEERKLINTIAHQLGVVIEHRELEAEQKRLHRQLRHADRLATIGKLAAGLAHELNEPLGNVLGFAQLLLKDETLPKTAQDDISKIEYAALHGREIVRKLMLFARQTQPKKDKVHINKIVYQALSLLESRLSKEGVTVDFQLGQNIPETILDGAQFVQIIVNLVVNAAQAMPNGGKLIIKTDSDKENLILIVTDTGVGMTDAVRQQIFLPFFTTKDVNQGTGLGLSVVHGIITAHRGTIKVNSKPGKGTTFTIQIPIVREWEETGKTNE